MKLATEVITLKTKHPFVIARGGDDESRVVWVRLTDADGVEGWGEADPSRYYGETADTVLTVLQRLAPQLPRDPFDLEAAEARFAEAMSLLADGNVASAESAFVAVSQQQRDVNVAVASQVMLAATLRYERKWSELRDLPLNSRLGAEDRMITSDPERWGKAFTGAAEEVITFPDMPLALRLNLTPVGTPTVRVLINGKQYDFWLDTGSSMTVDSTALPGPDGQPKTTQAIKLATDMPAR